MAENLTTQDVQCYLDELAEVSGDARAQAIVRALLGRAVDRLHLLCASLLHRSYPRLARGPLNLQPEEMLSSVVERLIKAMREVHPPTVRQFFALVNQHMRWELNDLARRLDEKGWESELRDPAAPAQRDPTPTQASPKLQRILAAIEGLPEDERETFNLVRIQGMTQTEAAEVVGVSPKTIQRRLVRCTMMLSEQLGDLVPPLLTAGK